MAKNERIEVIIEDKETLAKRISENFCAFIAQKIEEEMLDRKTVLEIKKLSERINIF